MESHLIQVRLGNSGGYVSEQGRCKVGADCEHIDGGGPPEAGTTDEALVSVRHLQALDLWPVRP